MQNIIKDLALKRRSKLVFQPPSLILYFKITPHGDAIIASLRAEWR